MISLRSFDLAMLHLCEEGATIEGIDWYRWPDNDGSQINAENLQPLLDDGRRSSDQMRRSQKEYFRTKSQSILRESKKLEDRVDRGIIMILERIR